MSAQEPPDDVLNAVKLIRKLRDKPYPTREDKIDLNRAKLRVAYWACRSESIVASRENLSYVLGEDAADIMGAYDRYLEAEKNRPGDGKQGKTRRKIDTRFWGGS